MRQVGGVERHPAFFDAIGPQPGWQDFRQRPLRKRQRQVIELRWRRGEVWQMAGKSQYDGRQSVREWRNWQTRKT